MLEKDMRYVLAWNIFHTFSSIYIVDFEHVFVCWVSYVHCAVTVHACYIVSNRTIIHI